MKTNPILKNNFSHLLVVAFILLILACTSDEVAGGSTDVETGGIQVLAQFNGVDSTFETTEGTRLILNQVNDSLLADSLYKVKADFQGLAQFNNIPVGTYNLESFHRLSGKRNLNLEVEITADSITTVESTLHTPGSIKVVNIPDSILGLDYFVYIPSLRLQKSLSVNANSLSLDSIPAGASIEVRYGQELLDLGLIGKITLKEGQDAIVNWP